MMSKQLKTKTTALCSCGNAELEVLGAPITSAACYCNDCQAGSRQIEALPNARSVLDPYGGTEYVLYRKDRVECSKGAQFLKTYKLREKSATNRVVATCCNSAMFLKFDDSRHWVSVYRARIQGDVPPLQMRVFTKHKPEAVELPCDVRSYSNFPLSFIAKLVAANIAMLLRR